MPAPNHYEVLGLTASATTSEIEQRYGELWSLYGADGSQAPMMKLLQEARRVLTSPALRDVYDEGLRSSSGAIVSGPQTPPVPPVPQSILTSSRAGDEPIPLPPSGPVARSTSGAGQERTTIVSRPVRPSREELPRDDERKLAHELSRRGVAPGEIERLLALGQEAPVVKSGKRARKLDVTPLVPPSEAYVPKPTIALPEFRQSSAHERIEADRKLTNANISRRRGNFAEAERECRAALDLIPSDGAALELYGDILQSVGRVDDALYAYGRAKEADPSRRTAEKKYAELMLLQNREIELLRADGVPRSPTLAVMLSSLFPGVGQIYNGDTLKGLIILVLVGSCIYLLGWTNFGFSKGRTGLDAPLVFFTVVGLLTYAYALVDANASARRGKRQSGWDV